VSVSDGRLLITTGEGGLEVKRIQLEGRGVVTAGEFLRGYPAIEGARLPENG
jgi:methionyl-tRNA formyltransferase